MNPSLSVLHVEPGDIIVIHGDPDDIDLKEIQDWARDHQLAGALILQPGQSVERLTPAILEAMGWVQP